MAKRRFARAVDRAKRGGVEPLVHVLDGDYEPIAAVFPKTEVQVCMRTKVPVHLVRTSVWFIPYKERKGVRASLKTI
ncbi:hypothetical protein Holit_02822 [Hollandina sp. SP2]